MVNPPNLHLGRWMLFVDGENFTLRAQSVALKQGIAFLEGPYHLQDTFVWFPRPRPATHLIREYVDMPLQPIAVRAYYYTSVVGDEGKIRSVREALWNMQFQSRVFKKRRTQDKAKGVDIALTTDVLSNAHNDNYDVAVLCAGDGDYVPLVEEVKRLGKRVGVTFFHSTGLNDDLRLAADWCPTSFENDFMGLWKAHSLRRSGNVTKPDKREGNDTGP